MRRRGAAVALVVQFFAAVSYATTPVTENAACTSMSLPGTGTIHYFCDCGTGASAGCTNGSSAANGLTQATAKRTWSDVQGAYNLMSAGDTLALCKGGVFTATASTAMLNTGSSGSPLTVMYYAPSWGTGSEPIPKININSGITPVFMVGGANPVTPRSYTRIYGIDFEGGGVASHCMWLANGQSNIDICGNTLNDCDTGIEVSNSTSPCTGGSVTCARQHDISFHGNICTNNNSECGLGGGPNLYVGYNAMSGNSHYSGLSHGFWYDSQCTDCPSGSCALFTDPAYTCTNAQFIGNTVDSSGRPSDTSGKCNQAIWTAHGVHSGIILRGNTIHQAPGTVDLGCYGLSPTNGDPYAESFDSLTIEDNVVEGWGGIGINLGSVTNSTIQNNLLISSDVNSLWGIVNGRDTPSGSDPDANCTNNSILYNTIYYLTAHNASYPGMQIGGQGTGYEVVGNVIVWASGGGFQCFVFDLTGSSYAAYSAIDYNDCYSSAGPTWESDTVGGTGKSLATWKAATSFDAHSKSVDPQFITPGLGTFTSAGLSGIDYRPRAAAVIGAGESTFRPALDFNGITRPSPATMGAFEPTGSGGAGGAGGAGGSGGSGGVAGGKASFFGFGGP